MCGLVAWAVDHPDQYGGWDAETVSAALRWTFEDAEAAEEVARRLSGD